VLVKEELGDLFKPKTDEEIALQFRRTYGVKYLSLEDILSVLENYGVDAEENRGYEEKHDPEKDPIIRADFYTIYKTVWAANGIMTKTKVLVAPTKEFAKKLKNSLEKYAVSSETLTNDIRLDIEKDNSGITFLTQVQALFLIEKLEGKW
jgi:hypothetical protein